MNHTEATRCTFACFSHVPSSPRRSLRTTLSNHSDQTRNSKVAAGVSRSGKHNPKLSFAKSGITCRKGGTHTPRMRWQPGGQRVLLSACFWGPLLKRRSILGNP